jgi:clavulanate-9-aldehyde reducatase
MAALDGKTAAVTGASSGIGEATTRALADAGAQVAICARRADRLEALAASINDGGGRALAVEADITDEQQARSFIERTRSELGSPDILVNNAGLMLLGPVEGADTDEWRRMLDVNLLGLLYCTHAVLPLMRENGGGHIVNVSSVAGRSANAGSAVYNMTKFGVTAFSEALRQEALGSNIRVTVVEPGFVSTELQGHNENPAVKETIERMRTNIGEVLEAEDIAASILYAVTAPGRVNVNEILVRPTGQSR